LLLFDRLWDLFDAADKNVIEDKRVFKGEFVGMYSKLHSLADIVVLGTLTKEQWEAEFALLDKNGDGFINFTEFCTYCVAHIERPFDFPTGDDGADGEEGEDHDQEKEGSALILLHSNTGKIPISGESAIEAVMAAEAAQAATDAANEAAAAAAEAAAAAAAVTAALATVPASIAAIAEPGPPPGCPLLAVTAAAPVCCCCFPPADDDDDEEEDSGAAGTATAGIATPPEAAKASATGSWMPSSWNHLRISLSLSAESWAWAWAWADSATLAP
jgi:Ca2+-binding EF-hand superfamily protein